LTKSNKNQQNQPNTYKKPEENNRMIGKDIKEIVPQIPGESDASYNRLILFLKKGFGTLKEYAEYLQEEQSQKAVTLATLETNSAKDQWSKRRKKYQQIRDQEIQEEVEQLFQQLNTHSIHDMQDYIDDLNKLKKDFIQQYNEGDYKASTTLRLLKDYITCYRQATEIYYINSRHQLFPDNTDTQTTQTDDKLQQISQILYGDKP